MTVSPKELLERWDMDPMDTPGDAAWALARRLHREAVACPVALNAHQLCVLASAIQTAMNLQAEHTERWGNS